MSDHHESGLSRRTFLALGASCGAHLLLLARANPAAARTLWRTPPRARVVAQEAWGRIEQLSPGAWALVSTPLQDRLTLCNGAIVAGRSRLVVVEAFASAAGAAWLLQQAERLAGRRVDDVVVTHFHADHTGGIATGGVTAGNEGARRTLQATSPTIELVRADDIKRQRAPDAARTATLDGAVPLPADRATELDLGGRTLRVVPRDGHTASDVTLELDDPSVVIAGDLLWNGMFPNYVDATPSALARSVRALVRERETVYVPGHGPVADAAAVRRYLEVLELVEAAARRAHQRGMTAAEAAKEFALPASLGEWYLFSPRFYEVALGAWERELQRGTTPAPGPTPHGAAERQA